MYEGHPNSLQSTSLKQEAPSSSASRQASGRVGWFTTDCDNTVAISLGDVLNCASRQAVDVVCRFSGVETVVSHTNRARRKTLYVLSATA